MGLKHNWKRIRESFKTTESKIYHNYNKGLTLSLTTYTQRQLRLQQNTEHTGIYTEPTEYSQSTHLRYTGVNTTNYNEEIQRWSLETQDNNENTNERGRKRRERWPHPRNNQWRRHVNPWGNRRRQGQGRATWWWRHHRELQPPSRSVPWSTP